MSPKKRVPAAPAKKAAPRKAAPRKATAAQVRSERRRQTEVIAAKLNRDKRFGENTVVLASNVVVPDRWPTGALALDVAMSGGLPVNQWTEIVGNENSGKTTVTLKIVAANQKRDPDFFTVWVASESFDPDLADKCGVDRSRIYLIEENVMELAFEMVLEFLDGRGCDLVVIDSYPALVNTAEDEKGMDGFSPGRGAQVLNLFMRKGTKASKRSITADVEDRPFAGILINQWREKIGVIHGDPRTTPGGKGKNFWMYARLDVKRDEWITANKQRVGQAIKVTCFKMKGARPQQIGTFDFYFAEAGEFKAGDYDTFKQIINPALYFDVIGRSGNGYVGPEGQFIKSKDLLTSTLLSDVEWRAQVERDVLEQAMHGKAPTEEVEEDDDVAEVIDMGPARTGPRRRRKTV